MSSRDRLLREAKWEEVIVEYKGSIIKTFIKDNPVVYACPICGTDIHKPSFTSERDLFFHLVAHAKDLLNRRRKQPRRFH
ncbi:MAG: hypothetical protein GSR82_04115 [Desulfurococcales archaeon]|nr:hypothetical protein [Desulfurococcales archaeon]MEB3759194.1 hypothetical protein [Desulfurococcales archaeon]MEB3772851.1 hypothetical protein [Desulfurococcales archaeon]MEB3799340.1 hypothetical protein [Desulfurococcales archaeon]